MKPTAYVGTLLCACAMSAMSGCSAAATTPPPTQSPTAVPASATLSPSPSVTPSPTQLPTYTPTATAYPIFVDDFTKTLEPGWIWIRENDALWSLESEPGFLRIVLQGGHYLLPRNLLVRDVASENFQITTHVLFKPTTNYQFAGLLVYQDDGNRAEFGRAYCNNPGECVGNGVYFDAYQNDQFKVVNFATDTQLQDEAYLRIEKKGSQLMAYYSDDGATWYRIGEHELFISDPKVGLFAGQSNVVGAVALFDYFMLLETP